MANDPVQWLQELLAAFDLQLGRDEARRKDYQDIGTIIHEDQGRHNALRSYAGRIWVDGISPEAFLAALEAINVFQFKPPLPADEVEGIARWFIEGREQGKLGETQQQVDEEAFGDLGAPPSLSTDGATRDDSAASREGEGWQPPRLPDEHYVPRYVRYAGSRTDAPPQYLEALDVLQLSAVVGRGVRIPLAAKPEGMFCNIWLLLPGDSTLFRRSTSEDPAVDLLRAVDKEMFLAHDQSPQGFIEEMSPPGWLVGRSY